MIVGGILLNSLMASASLISFKKNTSTVYLSLNFNVKFSKLINKQYATESTNKLTPIASDATIEGSFVLNIETRLSCNKNINLLINNSTLT